MPTDADKPIHDYHEERTRVFCHLPLNPLTNEHRVVFDLVDYLEKLRKKSVNLKGYTKTVQLPPVLEGFWRSSTKKRFLQEDVVMFIIEFELTIRDRLLWATIAEIKQFIQQKYHQHGGKPQDEVWVVAHSIFRLK